MDFLFMLFSAVITIGFLVFIHEGGHYLAARLFGVRVTEFMLGLPGPSIGFTKGGTRFGVTAVPLGGYARVCGMEAGPERPHLKEVLVCVYERGTVNLEDVASACNIPEEQAYEALEELVEWGSITGPRKTDEFNTYRTPSYTPSRRALKKAQAAAKVAVEVAAHAEDQAKAGVETGTPATTEATTEVTTEATTEITTADQTLLVTYSEGDPRPVASADMLYKEEYACQYRSLPFWKRSVILLAGIGMNLLFALLAFIVIFSLVGVTVQNTSTGETTLYHASVLEAIQAGFNYIGMVVQAVAGLFNPATAAQTVSDSTSIVGIAVMSKDYFEAGLVAALSFMAMISVSLGIMNLLPIPPLDGGRFVVEIFQKISRRTVSQKVMNYLSVAGMVLFLGFFVIMLNQDIQRFVFGNW